MQAYVLHHAPRPSPGSGPHDVEIATRIAPDAMARTEAGIAPLCQALAFQCPHTDQATVVLGDIDDVGGVHIEKRWTDQFCRPDLQKLTILIKDLYAVVLAVGHEYTPVLVDPHAVRQVELSRCRARLAPGEEVRAIGSELVHPSIAVAVGDKHLARGC